MRPTPGASGKNRHWDKKSGQRGRGDTGKTAVVRPVKGKGNVVARVIENTNWETLEAFVRETVSNRVSLPLNFSFGIQSLNADIFNGAISGC
jgi:hypothetical protein